MIDPKQPPPGYTVESCDETALRFVIRRGISIIGYRGTGSEAIESSHRIYAAESRPAVIDFAERITSWLESFHGPQSDVIHEIAGIILAAARGERTLP